MTTSPSDPPADAADAAEATDAGDDAAVETTDHLAAFAAGLADRLGALGHSTDNGTVHIQVAPESWVESVVAAREDLPFFSWLSAIDWSREVEVGEPAENAAALEERFEVMCRLSSVTSADAAILVTTLPHDAPSLPTLTGFIAGAAWHEREAAEMFGIDFPGHPNLIHLYLPDSFEGNPLLKSYPLLSREVKPWPGIVDVEGMPSTENVEAEALAAAQEEEAE